LKGCWAKRGIAEATAKAVATDRKVRESLTMVWVYKRIERGEPEQKRASANTFKCLGEYHDFFSHTVL